MYETLYRKYRPQVFEDLSGNENIITAIKNSIISGKVAHAYLFSGPRGLGKTSIARLIAKSLNCKNLINNYEPCNKCENCISIVKGSFPDLIEIDAASNRGIDEIRELKEKVNYKPSIGKKKIYIIDEVHMLTKEAFNALLKTLEEPPSHIIFILATTEFERIPETILSRCQRYNFSLLDEKNIAERLKFISEKESINIDEKALYLISKETGGSVRDSITFLEKISSCYSDELISLEKVEQALGLVESAILKQFLSLMQSKNLEESIKFVNNLWLRGTNIESFFKQFAHYIKEDSNENIEFVLKAFDVIFSVLAQFRNEDNKKIISYIIISRLFNLENFSNIKASKEIKEHKESKKELKESKESKEAKEKEIKFVNKITEVSNSNPLKEITLEEIKASWDKICDSLKTRKISLMIFCKESIPYKLEGKNLKLGFKKEFSYHKETLEKSENLIILETLAREILNFPLTIEPVFLEEGSTEESELVKKMKKFFEGEL